MPRYIHQHRDRLEPSFFMKCLKAILGLGLIAATVVGISSLALIAPIAITIAAASIALILGGGFLLPWLFSGFNTGQNNVQFMPNHYPAIVEQIPPRQGHYWPGYGVINHGAHAVAPHVHGRQAGAFFNAAPAHTHQHPVGFFNSGHQILQPHITNAADRAAPQHAHRHGHGHS